MDEGFPGGEQVETHALLLLKTGRLCHGFVGGKLIALFPFGFIQLTQKAIEKQFP
jgi:hypothetical protein